MYLAVSSLTIGFFRVSLSSPQGFSSRFVAIHPDFFFPVLGDFLAGFFGHFSWNFKRQIISLVLQIPIPLLQIYHFIDISTLPVNAVFCAIWFFITVADDQTATRFYNQPRLLVVRDLVVVRGSSLPSSSPLSGSFSPRSLDLRVIRNRIKRRI